MMKFAIVQASLVSNALFFVFCFLDNESSVNFRNGLQRVEGITIDSATLVPISGVHIWTERTSSVSDSDGRFFIEISPGDTINFSHVSYRPVQIIYNPRLYHSHLDVRLVLRTRVLDEVRVSAFYSEEQLKKKILETEPVLTPEEKNAQDNSAIMTQIGKIAPPPEKTPAEMFFESLTEPKGVTLFSTNPNRGLFKAIRDIAHPGRLEIRHDTESKNTYDKINPFKVRLGKQDTIAMDTLKKRPVVD